MNFTTDDWFPSRLSFGKFKGRLYQEAREDAELRSWLGWLAESTNERSSAMGRWYLRQQLWKKLVRMFHPDLHEHDPEKRKTYELLTQAINEARDRGDIGLLELIAKDPQAFILKQGWASVSLDGAQGLKELRSLYEHLQARILEIIETLDERRDSPEMEIFRSSEENESVIREIVAAQREELEEEIAGLKEEAERVADEARELAGDVPF